MDIKKNDILTVEITDTGTEGEGIGKLALPAPDAADTEEKAGGKPQALLCLSKMRSSAIPYR